MKNSGFKLISISMIGVLSLLSCEASKTASHKLYKVKEKEATCTEKGWEEHYECKHCDRWYDLNKEERTQMSLEYPKIRHDFITHEEVLPTETDDGVALYYECKLCNKLYDLDYEEISEIPVISHTNPISLLYKKGGRDVDMLMHTVRGYLNTKDAATYLYDSHPSYELDHEMILISWYSSNKARPYHIEFASDIEFKNITLEFTDIDEEFFYVRNLIPGMNYYRIVDANGNKSEVDSINVIGPLRAIYIANTIQNMRDIGGLTTYDGHKIKYGMIYRSAGWNNIFGTSLDVMHELKMKTELDIRYSDSLHDFTSSLAPVDGINFINYGMGQYTQIIPGGRRGWDDGYANLGNIFNVLADPNNYPLTYHCSAGADRTGTLSLLIEGLLGITYEQIIQDFEITTFYLTPRFRSALYEDENDICCFDPSGIMQDDNQNYVAFDYLINEIKNKYPSKDGSLSGAIENYLKTVCNVSDETLNAVKNNLLD